MDGSSTQTEAWVVWHNTGPLLGLLWDQVWCLPSGEQRGRLQSPGWLEMCLGSSSPAPSPLLDPHWLTLVTLPVVSCSREVSASCVQGGESVHSFVMLPSLEIQQLWRKLYLEEQ